MDGYAIRPPQGWIMDIKGRQIQGQSGISYTYRWTTPTRPDKTGPELVIVLGKDTGPTQSAPAPEVAIGQAMQPFTRGHTQLVTSPIEKGVIGDESFVRGYWKGIGPRTGKMFHGMVYVHTDSSPYVIASGKDREPDSRTTVPLCEAAILTLRKL